MKANNKDVIVTPDGTTVINLNNVDFVQKQYGLDYFIIKVVSNGWMEKIVFKTKDGAETFYNNIIVMMQKNSSVDKMSDSKMSKTDIYSVINATLEYAERFGLKNTTSGDVYDWAFADVTER